MLQLKSRVGPSICLIGAMVLGCASPTESRRYASSRVLSCGPNEIAVSNITSPGMSMRFYWDAVCKGIRYNCTGIADGRGDTTDVVCK